MPTIAELGIYFVLFCVFVYFPYKLYEVHYRRMQKKKRDSIIVNAEIKGIKIPIAVEDAYAFSRMKSRFKRMFYLEIRNKLKKGKIKPVTMDNGSTNYANTK